MQLSHSLGKRYPVLVAELLVDQLIDTYQKDQIPAMQDWFERAGFPKSAILRDNNKVFQMIVLAAYDKKPFTQIAGGSEALWGISPYKESLPALLDGLSVFDMQKVLRLSLEQIENRLSAATYYDTSIVKAEKVQYRRTIQEAARAVDRGLADELRRAGSTEDIRKVFCGFDDVHGIGETIASKLTKYLFRELQVGRVQPSDFPLDVVWPITGEYHILEAARLLQEIDISVIYHAMGLLLYRGEPYAIDALYYLHRHKPQWLKQFIEDALNNFPSRRPGTVAPLSTDSRSEEKIRQLMQIIEEICNEARMVTDMLVRQKGLNNVVSATQIKRSAEWLRKEMADLAGRKDMHEMKNFYENCLSSDKGKLVGWALSQLGKKSMESEYERFKAIYEEP